MQAVNGNEMNLLVNGKQDRSRSSNNFFRTLKFKESKKERIN